MIVRFIKKVRIIILVKIVWRKYKLGKNFHAGVRVRIWGKSKIEIGDNFYIGRGSQIECDCLIGDNVILGNNVALIGKYDHCYQEIGVPTRLSSQIRDDSYSWKGLHSKIIIHDDVWIGYGSIILSDVEIGTGSIIAAGSIVSKDVQPYCIYGGVPAKKLANRFDSEVDLNKHVSIIERKGKLNGENI